MYARTVIVMEFDGAQGCRLIDTFYFSNDEKAIRYRDEVNSKNTEKIAPDWYIAADLGDVVNAPDDLVR